MREIIAYLSVCTFAFDLVWNLSKEIVLGVFVWGWEGAKCQVIYY